MSLRERLAQGTLIETIEPADGTSLASRTSKNAIVRNLHFLLIEEIGADLDRAENGDVDRGEIEAVLRRLLERESTPLSAVDRREIIEAVLDNVLGYGPIEPLLADPTVT